MFIDQLKELKPSKSNFDRYVYLLERLVLVKVFVLLVEMDPPLLVELFNTLFGVISEEHSQNIQLHFKDIIVSCLEDSKEITVQLLETVLQYLVTPLSVCSLL